MIKERTDLEDKKVIDFYCKVCKKSMKMSYMLCGDDEAPVMSGNILRCHTRKCTKVSVLRKYTEGMIKANAKDGKFYV